MDRKVTLSTKLLQDSLGVAFKDAQLLVEALTHRSYLNEARMPTRSNERLEFLGDAILSFIISHYLFQKFSDIPEGELTNLRSATVKTPTLALAARNLRLGDYLRMSRGEEDSGGKQNDSLLADTFEAVVGAIFLDQGLAGARLFVGKHLMPIIPRIIATKGYLDFKSELQETIQASYRISPVYKVVDEHGPDHAKMFDVAVFVRDEKLGHGVGRSKQMAEQLAAKAALEKLNKT